MQASTMEPYFVESSLVLFPCFMVDLDVRLLRLCRMAERCFYVIEIVFG